MNRKMLGKLLKSVGHACDEADDGDVAVAKVILHPFAVPHNCATSYVCMYPLLTIFSNTHRRRVSMKLDGNTMPS